VATPTSNSVTTTTVNPLATGLGKYTVAGQKWGGDLGQGVTLTYSFPTTTSKHAAAYGYYGNAGEWLGFSPLSTAEQAAAKAGMAAWAAVANIKFVQVADSATSAGELRFGKTSYDTASEYAHAYYPAYDPSAGDVWLSTSNWHTTASASIAPGTDDFHTLIHELGHALGLKHSFEAPNAIPTALDSYFYTVMSYSARGLNDSGTASFLPTTPMYYDLLGIQALYGRNLSHNAGNTVYKFVDGQHYFQTIDDASGFDTIVYQGTSASTINLNQGSFSSLSAPIVFDNGSTRATVAIGPNTVIENATGGSGNDTITGNSVANALNGGAGNDKIYGCGGNDVLTGGLGNDSFYFNTAPSATGNHDAISDFSAVQDSIYLSHTVFTKLAAGAMSAAYFFTGAAAHDANDYVVYDKAHGTLSYDSNGSLANGSTVFATVAANTALTAADIIIY
jgi:Ca2+-binding RTX toxin-like protein